MAEGEVKAEGWKWKEGEVGRMEDGGRREEVGGRERENGKGGMDVIGGGIGASVRPIACLCFVVWPTFR